MITSTQVRIYNHFHNDNIMNIILIAFYDKVVVLHHYQHLIICNLIFIHIETQASAAQKESTRNELQL